MSDTTSAQEIFDKVVTHLRGMKRQSKRPSGGCAYRGMDGATCAVGCLISDEEYDPDMEGKSVWSGRFFSFPSVGRLRPYQKLLESLQTTHDAPDYWIKEGLASYVEEHFQSIAVRNGLTYTPRAEAVQ